MKHKITASTIVAAFAVLLSNSAVAGVTITANGTITDTFSSLNVGDSISIQFEASATIGAPNGDDTIDEQEWLFVNSSQPFLWNSVTSPALGGTFTNSFPGDQMNSWVIGYTPSLNPISTWSLEVLAAVNTSGFNIGLTEAGDPVTVVSLVFRGSDLPLITNTYFTGQQLDERFKNGTFSMTDISSGEVVGSFGQRYAFSIDSVTITGAAIPEPSSVGLVLVGVFGAMTRRRRN